MKNFPLKDENGKTWWVSRSVAVTGCIFTMINNQWYVLANQRGKGASDFRGLWNMPCGFLDYDETTAEAVVREVYEETGVKVDINTLQFWKFIDAPTQNKQNITFRYYALLSAQPDNIIVGDSNENRGGEKDEVSAISWIPVSDVDDYQWAFNHNTVVKELVSELQLKNKTF